MRDETTFNRESGLNLGSRWFQNNKKDVPQTNRMESIVIASTAFPRYLAIGLLLTLALFAFEIFNFDTTRYALSSLLGETSFLGFRWAAILAIAFCAIDFAGLAYLLAPERGQSEARESWYLMGAWLLGATMNALMTWWAVSLTLLSHDFGNEVMSRGDLLHIVPIFVAVLVWLTRILFIGAFSAAGGRLSRIGAPSSERIPETQKASSRRMAEGKTREPIRGPAVSLSDLSDTIGDTGRSRSGESTLIRRRVPRQSPLRSPMPMAASSRNRRR